MYQNELTGIEIDGNICLDSYQIKKKCVMDVNKIRNEYI